MRSGLLRRLLAPAALACAAPTSHDASKFVDPASIGRGGKFLR